MSYLADANLICEPTKSRASETACLWLEIHSDEIVIDAVVLGEIWDGIVSLPEGRKKRDLEQWFVRLRSSVECLPWTDETAVSWAELNQDVRRRGFTVGVKDTMIAASAKAHGLTVATRNVADFTLCGVPVVNPFD
jgi:toxin FitB